MNNKYFIPKKSHIEKKLANFDITNNVSYVLRNQQIFSWINFKHIFVSKFITHFKLKTSITIVELRDI